MRDVIALIGLLDNPNVQAFLRLIRAGESSQDDDAYRWLFGSTRKAPKLFDSFADHPRVRTYEAYDGQFIKNGKIDYTTAAGAGQITETTWNGVAARLGLKDFSPKSQDLAMVALIDQRGAMDDVLAGAIERAMFKCRMEWASLPASTYGQPTQSVSNALAVYRRYGGLMQAVAADPAPRPPQPILAAAAAAPATPQEPAMAPIVLPLLSGIASNLIEAFTPLAREKLTKEMGRHTDSPEVAGQVATAIIDTAKALTGKDDPLEAAVTAKADPAVMQQLEQSALDELERLAPVLDKLAQWDREAWADEEASRAAAAQRAAADPNDQDVFLTRSIVGMVMAMLVALAILIGLLSWLKVDGTILSGVVTLFTTLAGVVVGKFGTRYDHRYGSSRGSSSKDVVIGELSRRGTKG